MTLVVKIGGAAGVLPLRLPDAQRSRESGVGSWSTEAGCATIAQELGQYVANGERVVLVHGGSDLTNSLSQRLGHPMRTITSPNGMTSRYTDRETLDIFAMATAGQINTELVALLQQRGVNALGLAGVDGRLLLARRKAVVRSVTSEGRVQIVRDDYTGQIEQVNANLLHQLLTAGYTPVIAPLALSYEGERLNVDGDRAAAAIAAALGAETLAIMTNVPGLLSEPGDDATLIPSIAAHQLEEYMHYAQGRMRKKLLGAQEALRGGVGRVCIGRSSLRAVLDGTGTVISSNQMPSARTHGGIEVSSI